MHNTHRLISEDDGSGVCGVGWGGGGGGLNGPRKQQLEQQTSWQQTKHDEVYSDQFSLSERDLWVLNTRVPC